MHRSVVERILFPLHEAVMNRPTVALRRLLEASQWWPALRMQELRVSKLRRLIAHARAHCPYWRERLDSLNVRTGDIRTLDDLQRLPLMTRQDIESHRERMRWKSQTGKQLVYRTSGTTDDNLDYYWSRRRQAWDIAARLRAHRWFGLGPGSLETYIWPVETRPESRRTRSRDASSRIAVLANDFRGRAMQALRRGRDWCLNDQLVDAMPISRDGRCGRVLASLQAHPPDCLFGYPSTLSRLCRRMQEIGRHPSLPNLRCVIVTGEALYDSQRRLIEDTLGASVYGEYGVQEAGLLARQCPEGSWHETSESTITEWLTDGRPTPPGQLGEVVVTQLESLAMPIIRYRTGDMAVAASETVCRCGRTLRVVPEIVGRKYDFLMGDEGPVPTRKIVGSLDDLLVPESYCLRQGAAGHTAFSVLAGAGLNDEALRFAGRRVESLLASSHVIEVHSVRTWNAARSGKHRPVVSEIPHPNVA